jgi:hypothetical protein
VLDLYNRIGYSKFYVPCKTESLLRNLTASDSSTASRLDPVERLVDEPFGLSSGRKLMSSRSGSKTIPQTILIKIRKRICESKH